MPTRKRASSKRSAWSRARYEPLEIRFDKFRAPVAGRYKLRFNTLTFWAGPREGAKWWVPDRDKVSAGRRSEPLTIYSEAPPRLLRRLGTFDADPEAAVKELDVWLLKGESIQPDASRLFRSRPPNWHNPLATEEGMPGVAFRWLEVEGPIYDDWPTAGQRLLFGDLPLKPRRMARASKSSPRNREPMPSVSCAASWSGLAGVRSKRRMCSVRSRWSTRRSNRAAHLPRR